MHTPDDGSKSSWKYQGGLYQKIDAATRKDEYKNE